MMSRPSHEPVVIDPRPFYEEYKEPARGWYAEWDWRVWSLGIMLDLSNDWRWCGIKLGPLGLGFEWRRG